MWLRKTPSFLQRAHISPLCSLPHHPRGCRDEMLLCVVATPLIYCYPADEQTAAAMISPWRSASTCDLPGSVTTQTLSYTGRNFPGSAFARLEAGDGEGQGLLQVTQPHTFPPHHTADSMQELIANEQRGEGRARGIVSHS